MIRFLRIVFVFLLLPALGAWAKITVLFGTPFPDSKLNSLHVSDLPWEVFVSFFILFFLVMIAALIVALILDAVTGTNRLGRFFLGANQ